MSRPTRFALVAVVVLGLLPSLALSLLQRHVGLGQIGPYIRHHAGTDSWDPIALALDHLERKGPAGLYQATYFHTSYQFVYSPLSLAVFRWGNLPPLLDWHDAGSLNRVSWWVVLLTAVTTAGVLLGVPARPAEKPAIDRRMDLAVRGGLAFAATMLFYPAMKAYTVGNLQSWLNLLYVMAILSWVRGRPFATGLVLGLASAAKPQMSLFLIWALLRGERRLAWGMLAAVVPLAVISLTRFGWPIHAEYLALVSHLSGRGEAYYASQCMNALLNRMFFIGNNLQWDGAHSSIPYEPNVHAATVLSSIAMILASMLWRRGKRGRDPLDFCTAMVTFTIAAPIAFEHHYGFMVPVFWLVLTRIVEAGEKRSRLALLAVAYLACTNYFWPAERLAPTHLNILQSYLYLGALVVLGLMYRLRALASDPAAPAAAGASAAVVASRAGSRGAGALRSGRTRERRSQAACTSSIGGWGSTG